jgi:hypothetical protein
MFQFKVPVLLVLGWAAIWLAPLTLGQGSDASKAREINVPGGAGEPVVKLKISTEGRRGVVSVRNEGGTEVQSLGCPLLRDDAEATQEELATVREQFVSQFVVLDFDFDRHPDLAGIREFGAKWARYCVWLYDPKQHIFVKNFLGEQMELLTNLSPLEDGLVSSSSMGPTDAWRAVYRIVGAEGSRPERQLVPVFSCLLETTPGGEKPIAVLITRYEGGQAVVERREAVKMDRKAALGLCSSAKQQATK